MGVDLSVQAILNEVYNASTKKLAVDPNFGSFDADLVPDGDNTRSIGSATKNIKTLFIQTSMVLKQTTASYTVTWANPAAARAISIPDPGATDVFVFAAATQELDNKTLDSSVLKGTFTASGTVTLPAVTFGGVLNVGGNAITNAGSIEVLTGSVVNLRGTTTLDADDADNASFVIRARDTGVGRVEVARVQGAADPYFSFGGSQQHKFYNSGAIDFGSAAVLACVGTGANGMKLKNLKNAAASALSGTQLDVEIDIGGTPYYFTVYPTKA